MYARRVAKGNGPTGVLCLALESMSLSSDVKSISFLIFKLILVV